MPKLTYEINRFLAFTMALELLLPITMCLYDIFSLSMFPMTDQRLEILGHSNNRCFTVCFAWQNSHFSLIVWFHLEITDLVNSIFVNLRFCIWILQFFYLLFPRHSSYKCQPKKKLYGTFLGKRFWPRTKWMGWP